MKYTIIAVIQTALCLGALWLHSRGAKIDTLNIISANAMVIVWCWAWALAMNTATRWKQWASTGRDKFIENVTGDHHL